MTPNRKSAKFLAELEGEATPFAAAPRHMAARRDSNVGVGNQTLAISSVHEMVLEALLATGYESTLAERMAKEIAESVPSVQEKVQAAA